MDERNVYLEIGGKDDYPFGAFDKITGELAWHIGNDEYRGNYDRDKFLQWAKKNYGTNAIA